MVCPRSGKPEHTEGEGIAVQVQFQGSGGWVPRGFREVGGQVGSSGVWAKGMRTFWETSVDVGNFPL